MQKPLLTLLLLASAAAFAQGSAQRPEIGLGAGPHLKDERLREALPKERVANQTSSEREKGRGARGNP